MSTERRSKSSRAKSKETSSETASLPESDDAQLSSNDAYVPGSSESLSGASPSVESDGNSESTSSQEKGKSMKEVASRKKSRGKGQAGGAQRSPSPAASEDHPTYLTHPRPFLESYLLTTPTEKGVWNTEPYTSALKPYWRFANPDLARQSAEALWERFQQYGAAGDAVGMDVARKFIQMGMTRAQRYANYKGGRKYNAATGEKNAKGKDFEGKRQKEDASRIFREYWERCKHDERYLELKEDFEARKKDLVR